MEKTVLDFFRDPIVQELIEKNNFSGLLDVTPYAVLTDVVSMLMKSGIDFTSYLKSIPPFTFTYIKLPELDLSKTSIEKLDHRSFYESGIRKIILPKTLNYIGEAAFARSFLQSIEIPEGVEDIKKDTFQDCYDLAKIELPISIKQIEEAFTGCYDLKYIKYEGTANDWKNVKKVGDTKFITNRDIKVHCSDGMAKYDD